VAKPISDEAKKARGKLYRSRWILEKIVT